MLAHRIEEQDLRLFAEAATLRALGQHHLSRRIWLALERQPASFFSNTKDLQPLVNGYVEQVGFECLSDDMEAKRWKSAAPIAHDLVRRLRLDCAHEETGASPWLDLSSAYEYEAYAAYHLNDTETAFERFLEAASLRDLHESGGFYAPTDRFNAAAVAEIRGFRQSDEKLLLQSLHESANEAMTAACNVRLGKMYLQTHRPAPAVERLKLAAKFFEKYPEVGMLCGGGMPLGFAQCGGRRDFTDCIETLMNGSSRIDPTEYVMDLPTRDEVRQWLHKAIQEARQKR